MSNANTGGPAFPSSEFDAEYQRTFSTGGMTLRDYFAAKALQSILYADRVHGIIGVNLYEHDRAEDAYRVADAMLSARSTEKARGA